MGNTYTLKQILFALRKEYIEVEKQLKELEKYVTVTGEIDDISFYVQDSDVPKAIDIYLRKKQTLVDKIRETLGLSGIYTRGVTFWMVPEEIDAACYWKRNKVCTINNSDEFRKSINDILECEFIKNLPLDMRKRDDELSLYISSFGTSLIDKNTILSPISYNSKGNHLSIRREGSIITPNYIDDLLNVKFRCEKFNDYYKGIIDKYEEKEIDIIDIFDSNYSQLEIIEQPKNLILKPKKNI